MPCKPLVAIGYFGSTSSFNNFYSFSVMTVFSELRTLPLWGGADTSLRKKNRTPVTEKL